MVSSTANKKLQLSTEPAARSKPPALCAGPKPPQATPPDLRSLHHHLYSPNQIAEQIADQIAGCAAARTSLVALSSRSFLRCDAGPSASSRACSVSTSRASA